MKRSTVLAASLASVVLLLAACGQGEAPPAQTPRPTGEQLHARAVELAHELLIVDTHVDLPYRLNKEMEDISIRSEKADFDYPRAREGGLNAPFMSIYVPASYQEEGGAKDLADSLIDKVEKLEEDWPDKFAVARSVADVRAQFTAGKISLPMGMENGTPIEGDLANVTHFYERGIRYITLAHSENNHISDSSFADESKWNGLSPFGREVVAEMNRVGIMIDVSHLSDEAALQVLEITRAPVIASHSSARKFTPGWERNISDELIRKVADGGGVVMINFGSAFLEEAANKQSTAFWDLVEEYSTSRGIDLDHPDVKAFRDRYWEEHERIYASLDDVVANIDYIVKLAGVDHVGFGSDFEGVGDSLPEGLKDVSGYPNIIYELLKKGYSEDDLRKICGENLMRVWPEVERVARMEPAEA